MKMVLGLRLQNKSRPCKHAAHFIKKDHSPASSEFEVEKSVTYHPAAPTKEVKG